MGDRVENRKKNHPGLNFNMTVAADLDFQFGFRAACKNMGSDASKEMKKIIYTCLGTSAGEFSSFMREKMQTLMEKKINA